MSPAELDGFVVAAWKVGKLAGKRLQYSADTEQMFLHYPTGSVIYSPVVFHGTKRCSDGSAYDEYGPRRTPAPGFDAVIHTHQDRAPKEIGHHPYPDPRDGVVPKNNHLPNYGLSSVGAWVVRPGPVLALDLLIGIWGERFNPEAFAQAMNRGGGDITVATGVSCR